MGYFLRLEDDPLKGLLGKEQLTLDEDSRRSIERLNHEMAVCMVGLLVSDASGPYLPQLLKKTIENIPQHSDDIGWEIIIDATWYMTRARLCSVSVNTQNGAVTIDQPESNDNERVPLVPVCPACLGTGTPQNMGLSLIKSLFTKSNANYADRIPPAISSACILLAKQIDEMRGRGAFDPMLKRVVETLGEAKRSIFHYQIQVMTRVVVNNGEVLVAVLRNLALPPIKFMFRGKSYEFSSNWEVQKETSIIESVNLIVPSPCPSCRSLRFNMAHKSISFSDRLIES